MEGKKKVMLCYFKWWKCLSFGDYFFFLTCILQFHIMFHYVLFLHLITSFYVYRTRLLMLMCFLLMPMDPSIQSRSVFIVFGIEQCGDLFCFLITTILVLSNMATGDSPCYIGFVSQLT